MTDIAQRYELFSEYGRDLTRLENPLIGPNSLPIPVTRMSDAFDPIKQLVREGFDISNVNILGGYISVKPGDSIQDAIDLLDARGLGGTVFAETGTHFPMADIDIPSEISLGGAGAGKTIIDFDGGAFSVNVKGTNRVVQGLITVTLGSTTVTGSSTLFTNASAGDTLIVSASDYDFVSKIESITSDTELELVDAYPMPTVSSTSQYNISLFNSNNLISDLTIQNSSAPGIRSTLTKGFSINNLELYSNGQGGIDASFLYDSLFTNVNAIYNGTASNHHGFRILDSRVISIIGCFAVGNTGKGFYFQGYNTASIVTGCLSDGNVNEGFYLTVNDAVISGCRAAGNASYGFSVEGSDRTLITGCFAYDNDADGIVVSQDSNDIKIIGNSLKNNTWGIRITGAAISINNYKISDNIFSGNSSGPITYGALGAIITGSQSIDFQLLHNVVTMKNTSGSSLSRGHVVTLKAVAAGNEVTTTTTQGDDLVLGVVIETIANNDSGRIHLTGKNVFVKVDGTTDIAIGDHLGTFTTAGIAMKAASGDMAFAIALEAYTTNDSLGVIDAILITPRKI